MRNVQRPILPRLDIMMKGLVFASTLGTVTSACAQAFEDLQTPRAPLVLKAQGSFFIGGETVFSDGLIAEQIFPTFSYPTSGHVAINQMYVRYMVPLRTKGNQPVVMVHGGTLSGKSYETTPDGRMGWDEYFVRKGHSVYVPDQVTRARSGFNQSAINNVRAGNAPPNALPNILRLSNEVSWTSFRIGPAVGVPYPNTQFPIEAANEFAKQGIPDFNFGLPSAEHTIKGMSDLAAKLKGAILMGHSESGSFPLRAALLDPKNVKGTIVIDGCPGSGGAELTHAEIASLVNVPMLGVLGDRRDPASCTAFINRFTAAGGHAEVIFPPDLGIAGNSHMIMNDRNHLQIADLILDWIDENVAKRKVSGTGGTNQHGHGR
jgi:pimeloyl-ACP methyl ester carboxylesterase